jgi:Retrotransposon gag protein
MNFIAKPTTYSTDHKKVSFAASYLKETALNHYTSLLQHDPGNNALHAWDNFTSEFGQMFGVSNTQIEAQQQLRHLEMTDRAHFNSYIVRFEEYAFDSGWNDAALQSELYRSLPYRIKEVMKTIPRPTTLL